MEEYGIIGYPLGHSFSPAYFREKFLHEGIKARYAAFPIERIEEFPALLAAHPQLRGLNVTIPHKAAVTPYLDALHPDAQTIGAVNCIAFEDGKSTGYNTDWIGFRDSLLPLLEQHHQRALVLGTGGAAKAVVFALERLRISFTQVSRMRTATSLSYEDLTPEVLAAHTLIVNTTPLGMHPDEDKVPELAYAAIGSQHLLYDLIYNPAETKFLAEGRRRGATIKNGEEMLVLQAEASWKIWRGETAEPSLSATV